jgi:hypothetical protein
MSGDIIAQGDQAKANARFTAAIVAAFYRKLIEEKVDMTTAKNLTQEYYKKLSSG